MREAARIGFFAHNDQCGETHVFDDAMRAKI
jgi:hypothetical protein